MKWLLILLLGILLSHSQAYAQEFSIKIEPAIIELSNDQNSAKITIQNGSNIDIRLFPQLYAIKSLKNHDNDYTIEKNTTSDSISKDIQIYQDSSPVTELLISSQSQSIFNIRYNRSYNKSKDNVLALTFQKASQAPPESLKTISYIDPEVGILLVLKATDPEVKATEITSFSVDSSFKNNVIHITSTLSNNSSSTKHIRGYISIYNIVNQKIADLSIDNLILLPNTSRPLTSNGSSIQYQDKLLGIYKVRLHIFEDQSHNPIVVTKNTVILPVTTIAIVSFISFVFISILVKALNKRK